MITRAEQKALFDSINGDLTINTVPDGSGNDVVIPIEVNWGFEPIELVLPSITINFIVYGRPKERTLGDLWRDTPEGYYIGYIATYSLLVKIRTADHTDSDNNFIEKTDIAESLYDRVFKQALHFWDSLVDEGSVEDGGIEPATDVSQLLGLEGLKELQLTIRIKKLTGGVPNEQGPVLFSTAPTILSVDGIVEFA